MALTQLAPPYPVFTDKNGDPLDNGYLYFGEVNKNPETNPIQVYYDSAFTQPAAQPLRTSNGYVMRNGSPALIYADVNFSVTIRDKNNALVIYSPVGYGINPAAAVSGSVTVQDQIGDGVTTTFGMGASPNTENATNVYIDGVYQQKNTYTTSGSSIIFSEAPPLNASIEIVSQESPVIGGASASQISYNEGSVGAVNRTVKAKLQEFVSVKDFGAVGDGVTDDTAAIQAALDYGGSVYVPVGDYRVTSTLTMSVDGSSLFGEDRQYFGADSRIFLDAGSPTTLIETDGEGYRFSNLVLDAGNNATGYIALKITPTSGTADRDIYITGCFIKNADSGIYMYGRGLHVQSCILAALQNAIVLDSPSPWTQAGGSDDTEETGFRAITVSDNRIQAISGSVVRSVSANADNQVGLTFVGNYIDGRGKVFLGSCRNATFSSNTVIHSNDILFYLYDVDGLTITGNTFAGQYDSTGNVTTPHDADIQNVIYMETGYSASSITFSGNTVANVYKDVFFLNGTWSDVNITGNTFNDCLRGNNDAGLSPTQYGIVRTNSNGSGLVFTNNVTNVGNYTRNAFLVNSGGSTVTNWLVVDNTFNSSNIGEQNLGNMLSASDYAVGTFTPLLTTNGTDFSSVTYSSLVSGKYIKIGKVVTAQVYMRTEAITAGSASGNVQIDLNDIPYGCEANTSGKADGFGAASVGVALGWTNTPMAASLRSGEKKLDLYKRSTTTSAVANIAVGDVATGATANIIQLSVTYITD